MRAQNIVAPGNFQGPGSGRWVPPPPAVRPLLCWVPKAASHLVVCKTLHCNYLELHAPKIQPPVFKRRLFSEEVSSPWDQRERKFSHLSSGATNTFPAAAPFKGALQRKLIPGPGWGDAPINKGAPFPYLGSSSQIKGL